MMTLRRLVLAVACLLPLAIPTRAPAREHASAQAQAPAQPRERDVLTRIRRLTVEGRRSGEGYWSKDGRRLVFQSEREPGNPFYQIYTLDLATGDTARVSPGVGKTTCSFFNPDTGDILFSSTHHDPRSAQFQKEELDFRASGRERRYSWDYDPEMELYLRNARSGQLRRLTNTRGYDAEGSVSPDGRWVVFSSTRDAYNRPLTAVEQKQLETDPSYFGEIYIMPTDADGSGVRRLTTVPGYDGGPFFSPDGRRIVWRRFDERGVIADVWTMNLDGTDARQLTDFGSMSWAPYIHPSGAYLVFSSNKLGFENFELYAVDIDGKKEPIRITESDGFDGLPVPSPDGTQLAWTSNRAGGREGHIFLAQWNHDAVLAALGRAPNRRQSTRAHVETLASALMEGREAGTNGERLAAEYIAAELARFGAKPLPGRADMFLPFTFTAGSDDAGSRLVIGGDGAAARETEFRAPADVRALSFSDDGVVSGPAVFAGYGIVVPDAQNFGYDSYAGLDVTDKIVVVLRYFPEDADPKIRGILARYSDLRYKAMAARQRGAKALVVVTGPRSPNAGEIVPMTFDTALAGSGLPAISVTGAAAAALFLARPLRDVQQDLDGGNPHVAGFALSGLRLTLTAAVSRRARTGRNVVAYLPATEPAADTPWLALGAHFDHLGIGASGNSLGTGPDRGRPHVGADDNASGTAAVLAIGAALASQPRRRHVLLGLWSAEEIGLVGSNAFVTVPPIPIAQVGAYLNFDMVGRMVDNKLTVQAVGSSAAWPSLLERANVAAGFDMVVQADPYQPTDVATFNQAGVPSLSFTTGVHSDYHKPTDTADKINYTDLDRIVQMAAAIVRRVDADPPMAFVKVEQSSQTAGRAGIRVFTGTVPDYASEAKGLLLSGVIGGGPAEQAGLQKGDIIVEIAGQSIANIYDYTYALELLKVGQPVPVAYTRNGVRRSTTFTPTARR
jgi:Tol biopolymer transport system component